MDEDAAAAAAAEQEAIERFRTKKLIRSLEAARGGGTSVVTLQITPKQQIAQAAQMLNNELGTSSNIKSHTNRLSVQSAITSALGRLKTINRTPRNGLILFSGTVLTEDNREKKMSLVLEPFKEVSRPLYLCDNCFHTEELRRMLESDDRFGFVIVDGSGTYYASVCGGSRQKLGAFTVDLPKKHGRGGQSKNRFARIREERRHHYLKKVCEQATLHFITQNVPNVSGLVLAGSADFKDQMFDSPNLDPRLKKVVLAVVDVAQSGESGLLQAMELSRDKLASVKLVREQKILDSFFDQIQQDTGQFIFGVDETMECVDSGAVDRLLIHEESPLVRYTIQRTVEEDDDGSTKTVEEIVYAVPGENVDEKLQLNHPQRPGQVIETTLFTDFLSENYRNLNCKLDLVSDRTEQGTKFVRAFGGIGALLRYRIDSSMLISNRLDDDEHGETEDGLDLDAFM